MTKSNTAESNTAQTPKQPPKPGPEHRRLDVFVGKWSMEGQQYESEFGPAAKLTAVETYEWLPGGFFLVHRFEGGFEGGGDDQEMACIEIIGHDAASQSYLCHSFYNDGKTNEWQARERDGIWTLTGDWQTAAKSPKVRCTTVFSDAGNTRTGKWERSSDGSKWGTFWDVKATKAK
ncbi:MAG: DUF1579 family protein [Acidobacteriota bacterium]